MNCCPMEMEHFSLESKHLVKLVFRLKFGIDMTVFDTELTLSLNVCVELVKLSSFRQLI